MTKDEMKEAIAKNVCTVVFEKVDGTERTMHCTTNLEFIPQENHPKSEGKAEARDNVIAAYDVAKKGWRSFRVDSVKEFKV